MILKRPLNPLNFKEMKQTMINGDSLSKTKQGSQLLEELEQIQQAEIETTRIVKLQIRTCCGCGCRNDDLEREVSIDSNLKDGDFVTKYLPGDIRL